MNDSTILKCKWLGNMLTDLSEASMTHKFHVTSMCIACAVLSETCPQREAHPHDALAETRPQGGYSDSIVYIYIYTYTLAEYPPFVWDLK